MRRRCVPTPALAAALVAASLPILVREARRTRDRRVLWTLLVAQQARLAASQVVWQVMERRYPYEDDPRIDAHADAHDYHAAGVEIAQRLRSGTTAGVGTLARTVPFDTRYPLPAGTNFVRLWTGGTYAVIGPSKRGGFLVFSWIGFWGLFCFYRAFALAVPGGNRLAYLRLLFASPSIMFWTSSVGKEAWMVLGLGTGALGTAHLATGDRRRGLALVAAGMALTTLVRPKLTGYFGLNYAAEDLAERSQDHEGSWFEPPNRSPRNLPRIAAGVLFRPYLHEARNAPARVAALEGTATILLSAARHRWVATALRSAVREPYVAFVLCSLAGSVAILSPMSNLGLLVRERSPILPLYLVLLAIPPGRS